MACQTRRAMDGGLLEGSLRLCNSIQGSGKTAIRYCVYQKFIPQTVCSSMSTVLLLSPGVCRIRPGSCGKPCLGMVRDVFPYVMRLDLEQLWPTPVLTTHRSLSVSHSNSQATPA